MVSYVMSYCFIIDFFSEMKTASVAFNFLLCFTQLDEFSDSN